MATTRIVKQIGELSSIIQDRPAVESRFTFNSNIQDAIPKNRTHGSFCNFTDGSEGWVFVYRKHHLSAGSLLILEKLEIDGYTRVNIYIEVRK